MPFADLSAFAFTPCYRKTLLHSGLWTHLACKRWCCKKWDNYWLFCFIIIAIDFKTKLFRFVFGFGYWSLRAVGSHFMGPFGHSGFQWWNSTIDLWNVFGNSMIIHFKYHTNYYIINIHSMLLCLLEIHHNLLKMLHGKM